MNPVLTLTYRGALAETIHRGSICVINNNHDPVFQLGDIESPTFPRSAMKLIQVLPLLERGAAEKWGLDDEEISIMCGSHNAEHAHVQVVQRMLRKCSINPSDLGCGAHAPMDVSARDSLLLSGGKMSELHNNCSGKHAGFLALAKFMGEPSMGYLDLEHSVQQAVRKKVCEMFEMDENDLLIGIDGCSAPNYGMPLRNMAIGFMNLARKTALGDSACARVIRAVTSFPYMVGGRDRFCTDLMKAAQGNVVAKLGADGVYCMALPEKEIGIAIKLDDGATGPQYNVAMALLNAMAVLPQDSAHTLSKYLETPILNWNGLQTGKRTVSQELTDELKKWKSFP